MVTLYPRSSNPGIYPREMSVFVNQKALQECPYPVWVSYCCCNKCPQTEAWNNTNLFSYSPGGPKSETWSCGAHWRCCQRCCSWKPSWRTLSLLSKQSQAACTSQLVVFFWQWYRLLCLLLHLLFKCWPSCLSLIMDLVIVLGPGKIRMLNLITSEKFLLSCMVTQSQVSGMETWTS